MYDAGISDKHPYKLPIKLTVILKLPVVESNLLLKSETLKLKLTVGP